MPGIIDADTHLFEPPQAWDHFDKELYLRRPVIVEGPKDTIYRKTRFWLIDGNIFPKPAGKGSFCIRDDGMTQIEAHSGPLPAGTSAAAARVASEKTCYVAYARRYPRNNTRSKQDSAPWSLSACLVMNWSIPFHTTPAWTAHKLHLVAAARPRWKGLKPFSWRFRSTRRRPFTRRDLAALLTKLAASPRRAVA
jgi:hypothetical protein